MPQSTLRCLYLEDDDEDFDYFSYAFQKALEPVRLQFVRAENYRAAEQHLSAEGSRFDVYFVDLLMKDRKQAEEQPLGMRTLEAAKRHPKLRVIGLTKAIGDKNYEHFLDMIRMGYPCLVKGEIRKAKEYSDVALMLRPLLKGVLPAAATLVWQEEVNVKLDAEIREVGKETLLYLMEQVDPSATQFTPHYVSPGLSGAVVLRVDAASSTDEKTFLVKLSRDGGKLRQELANVPKAGERDVNGYVRYLSAGERIEDPPWEHEGWYAIAAHFEGDTTSLYSWLTKNTGTPDDVRRLLNSLFWYPRQNYQRTRVEDTKTAYAAIHPGARTRARVVIAAEKLTDLLRSLSAEDPRLAPISNEALAVREAVENLIRSRGQGDRWSHHFSRTGTHVCMCHGDLHLQNVLVRRLDPPSPILIDTGNRAEEHWATDPARLAVDIWLMAWDNGPKSYFWGGLPEWRSLVNSWVSGNELPEKDGSWPAATALNWILRSLPDMFPKVYRAPELAEWEFRLSLAVQFLKFTTYHDKPVPKQCMALLAAYDLLRALGWIPAEETRTPRKVNS